MSSLIIHKEVPTHTSVAIAVFAFWSLAANIGLMPSFSSSAEPLSSCFIWLAEALLLTLLAPTLPWNKPSEEYRPNRRTRDFSAAKIFDFVLVDDFVAARSALMLIGNRNLRFEGEFASCKDARLFSLKVLCHQVGISHESVSSKSTLLLCLAVRSWWPGRNLLLVKHLAVCYRMYLIWL
jgi:hypothetical protein